MNWCDEAKALNEECIRLRRILHRHPELSSREENTVSLILDYLKDLDIETVNVDNGGVLGWIHGAHPGKTVMLRADIDALPITEAPVNEGGFPKSCVSENEGVQHACGHDGHTAMLLCAARLLQTHRDQLRGNILLCFERGEEQTMNVYHLMMYMEQNNIHPDAVFGMHVSPAVESGKIQIQPGPLMAGVFSFHVRIKGKGGHGSRPDRSINPIDCYAAIGQAIQCLRMRTVDPFDPLTISTGLVQSGTKSNILPDECLFKGTVRFYHRETGLYFQKKLKHMIEHIAEAYDCTVEFDKLNSPGFPLINTESYARCAAKVCAEVFEEGSVITAQPSMGTDSFALYLQRMPGVYAFLGMRNEEKGITANVHTSTHDLDEDQFWRGIAAHVYCARAFEQCPEDPQFKVNPDDLNTIYEQAGYTFPQGRTEWNIK